MICDVLVFRKIGVFGLLDVEPVLGPALGGVTVLLLRSHVRPADPVFILSLTLQVLQRIAFHLPCNLSWTTILSDPLLPGDAFPQQGEGEEHGCNGYLKRHNSSKRSVIAIMTVVSAATLYKGQMRGFGTGKL